MTTVVGKSGVRMIILGETPKRATADDGKPREMEVTCDGDKVYLVPGRKPLFLKNPSAYFLSTRRFSSIAACP